MAPLEFRRDLLTARILAPGTGEPLELPFEIRRDPLTGHTARLLRGPAPLLPASDFDVASLADVTRRGCPFCADRIEEATPRFEPELAPEGRFRRGEAVLFPNLLPYGRHASVSVYSPARHRLELADFDARLVADNLAVQVEFARAVLRVDPESAWISINANHMLPSGSSVFHPHLQGNANPSPTTMQRLLAGVAPALYRGYLDAERADGSRHVGTSERVEWLASFAPLAPAELRAFVAGAASPAQLDDELVRELAEGIEHALALYDELGIGSFNLALYGAPPSYEGYPLNLRLVARSAPAPHYRSDATWLERLHWEAAVDVVPEELAERARARFRR